MLKFIQALVNSSLQVRLVLIGNFLSAAFLVYSEAAKAGRPPLPDFFLTSAVFLGITAVLSFLYQAYCRRIKHVEPVHYAGLTMLALQLLVLCLIGMVIASLPASRPLP